MQYTICDYMFSRLYVTCVSVWVERGLEGVLENNLIYPFFKEWKFKK